MENCFESGHHIIPYYQIVLGGSYLYYQKKIYLQRGILPLCSVQKVQKTSSNPYLARQTPTSRHASNPYYVQCTLIKISNRMCDKCWCFNFNFFNFSWIQKIFPSFYFLRWFLFKLCLCFSVDLTNNVYLSLNIDIIGETLFWFNSTKYTFQALA